jgi:hypothetical protein
MLKVVVMGLISLVIAVVSYVINAVLQEDRK